MLYMDDAEEIDSMFDGITDSPPLLDALSKYLESATPLPLVRFLKQKGMCYIAEL